MSEQRILVLQTAVPSYVKCAMEDILAKNLLGPVRITLFCRAIPEEHSQFLGAPWISELCVHHEMSGALRQLLDFRRRRFDVVVAFFTADPSYWKIKWFAFLCRGRHLLIFNEHLGCFFYNPIAFLRFLWVRYNEWKLRIKQQLGYALGTPQGMMTTYPSSFWLRLIRPFHLLFKFAVFPFRFAYLLVWTLQKQRQQRHYLRRVGDRIHFLQC
jgi:hypothetical protein